MSSSLCNKVWSHPGKELKDHLIQVAEIAKQSATAIPINLPKDCLLPEIAYVIGLYHDIGKATDFFQNYLKESEPDQKARLKNQPESNHSLISAVATYFAIEELLKDKNFDNEFTAFLPIAAFLAVRRHHTNLQSAFEDVRLDKIDALYYQIENLNNKYKYFEFLPYWNNAYDKLKRLHLKNGWPLSKRSVIKLVTAKNNHVIYYLIQNILYSLLIDADKHEVTVGSCAKRTAIRSDMVKIFKERMGYDKAQKPVNITRNEIYQIVTGQIKNIDLDQNYLLSLTAPTGSGKTLTSLAFALGLRERIMNEKKYCPRIIYALPFLSIIDQNAQVIKQIFETATDKSPTSSEFLIHHHLSDFIYREENTEYGAEESEILIEGWDSEIIITTFVQLFHTLFSNQNRALRKFHKIVGGIIILDEIQAFPYKYWQLFRKTAEALAKYFNTYFILSTATQPAIFTNNNDCRELLTEKEKYFKLFNRTQITFNTQSSKRIRQFSEELNKNLSANSDSVMVVLNTIQSAKEIYYAVSETAKKLGYKTFFLSSHVVPKERLRRIEEIKNLDSKKLVISTQLVEAGVDIDFDRIIRDFGPIDSIVQVAGRANRHQQKALGKVEVLILLDTKTQRPFYSYIYDPVLIDNTKDVLPQDSSVFERHLVELVSQYYQRLLKTMSEDVSNEYLEAVSLLNYDKISEFNLIEEKGEKIDIFVELDDEAVQIWKQYQQIMTISEPLERKRCFKEIKRNFYHYVISVQLNKAKENLPPENLGIRYIAKSQLDDYYDLETGYKPTSEVFIW